MNGRSTQPCSRYAFIEWPFLIDGIRRLLYSANTAFKCLSQRHLAGTPGQRFTILFSTSLVIIGAADLGQIPPPHSCRKHRAAHSHQPAHQCRVPVPLLAVVGVLESNRIPGRVDIGGFRTPLDLTGQLWVPGPGQHCNNQFHVGLGYEMVDLHNISLHGSSPDV